MRRREGPALDFTLFTQWRDAASEFGARVAEADCWQRNGAWWQTRPDGKAREISGVDVEASRLVLQADRRDHAGPGGLVARFRGREGAGADRAGALGPRGSGHAGHPEGEGVRGETRDGQLARWADEYDAAFGRDITTLATQALGGAPGEGSGGPSGTS